MIVGLFLQSKVIPPAGSHASTPRSQLFPSDVYETVAVDPASRSPFLSMSMLSQLASIARRPRRLLRGQTAAAMALALLPALHAAGKPSDPVLSLPMETYGFQAIPARSLLSGATMLTLHFVDNTHMLFTFHTRGLMARMPDASPEDDDRRVTAVLIELPTGRELARTIWRTRDQEQYLWPLEHGRFLLRIRNKLTVLDPLRDLAGGHAFLEHPFLDLKRRIGYIAVSPGGDLLVVETAPPRARAAASVTPRIAAAGSSPETGAPEEPEPPARATVEIHLFRVSVDEQPGEREHLIAHASGLIGARGLLNIPATAEGFIDVTREAPGSYLFDFQSHAGKRVELAGYTTTCSPRPFFISRSEFVAFGCHGAADKIQLSGFNLRGEEPWIQVFSNQHVAPMVLSAPAAGRFVLSRVLVAGSYVNLENLLPQDLSAQEVTVMQNHDGRQLLKLQVAPIQRSGQNFDISPDGMAFAAIQNGQIAVYHLPALTAKDQKELKLALESEPERNEATIRLQAAPAKPENDAGKLIVSTTPAVVAASAVLAPPAAATEPAAAQAGDPAPEAPRKAPSLYDADHPKPPKP